MTYSMQCTCGHVMSVDAVSRDEAVAQLKGMMTQQAMEQHFAEKHPGEPVPPLEQTHMMIEQKTQEGVMAPPSGQSGPQPPQQPSSMPM